MALVPEFLSLRPELLEILDQKLRNVLEFRDVSWVELHQSLVSFQASLEKLLPAWCSVVRGAQPLVEAGRPVAMHGLEQLGDAEILEQVGNALIGVEQTELGIVVLVASPGLRGIACSLGAGQNSCGQDSQEGAVHGYAMA